MLDKVAPVSITPRALSEIKKIMETKNIPREYGLRVGVRGGGCGVSLMIGFDKRRPADLAYEIEGMHVYIEKKHAMYVIGKRVDFYEGADARGFMFVNDEEDSAPKHTGPTASSK